MKDAPATICVTNSDMKLDTNSRKRTGFDGYVFIRTTMSTFSLIGLQTPHWTKMNTFQVKIYLSILACMLQNLKHLADDDDYVLIDTLFEFSLKPTTEVED